MIAYNTTSLHNQQIHKNTEEALFYNLLDEAAYTKINEAYPVNLNTPNYFVRVGLALLTIIAGVFTAFLLGLMFGLSNSNSIATLLFFLALACYGVLELLVSEKKYYNAGIDNMLMTLTVIFLLAGCFSLNIGSSSTLTCALCFIVCLWMAYRFVDAFCSMLACLFFYFYIFFIVIKLVNTAQTINPFILMAISAIVYFLAKKATEHKRWAYHKFCLECIALTSMACFYASGNYYVIREILNSNLTTFSNKFIPPMAPSWIFWLFTIITPLAYLVFGIAKKNLLFMRTGVIFIATSILTIRYYHTFLPVDTALIIAGLLLILISYTLMKYLRTAKNGFSFLSPFYSDNKLHNAEALVAVEAFGAVHHASSQHDVEFGGGSSGGGGASGTF